MWDEREARGELEEAAVPLKELISVVETERDVEKKEKESNITVVVRTRNK